MRWLIEKLIEAYSYVWEWNLDRYVLRKQRKNKEN